jgi:prevent-host-death family protein
MKTVGAFDAKTHLAGLLAKVARGESFLITKHGKPIASLAPVPSAARRGPRQLVAEFRKQFAKSLKPFTLLEIKNLREEGRR